jgi:hypothetical protein
MPPTSLSIDELLKTATREFIILIGKDGSGKSSAIISLAQFVEQLLGPEATFFIIDTENKMKAVLQSWGDGLPKNIRYYKCESMNEVTEAIAEIMAVAAPGDWVAVESMSRVWEKAQDMGYLAVTSMGKAAWMERRHEQKAAGQKQSPVTPRPDDLWSIIKGAHDGAFLELLAQHETINVVLSTTLAKPPKEGGFRKESVDRAAVRSEFGLDMGIEGAPRLPYYAQTLCVLDRRMGESYCRILRDNLSTKDQPACEFKVVGKKEWAPTFWAECR